MVWYYRLTNVLNCLCQRASALAEGETIIAADANVMAQKSRG
jgi:hypothetical protein